MGLFTLCLQGFLLIFIIIFYIPIRIVESIIESTRFFLLKPSPIKIQNKSTGKILLLSMIKPGRIEENKSILLIAGNPTLKELAEIQEDLIAGIVNGYHLFLQEFKKKDIEDGAIFNIENYYENYKPFHLEANRLGISWGKKIAEANRIRNSLSKREHVKWIDWQGSLSDELPFVSLSKSRDDPLLSYIVQNVKKKELTNIQIPLMAVKIWDIFHTIPDSRIDHWLSDAYETFASDNKKAQKKSSNQLAKNLKQLIKEGHNLHLTTPLPKVKPTFSSK
ncbi:MAG: hypothetical protein GF308_16225 [Candidatus Heimdallarchaeota archaeon]|nr:hypothetical protein [Candidatus Heimdallarchaeota archaeon]